jgi:hypothetical protein
MQSINEHKTWFPKGETFISTTEYKQAILNNIEEVINNFQEIDADVNDLNLSLIENFPSQTYRIKGAPTYDLLCSLPYYKNCNSEVGIIKLNDIWFLILGREGEHQIEIPEELCAISNIGLFELFMHSHPANQEDNDLGQPSIEDIKSCNSTIDGCQYIITEKGITEICKGNISREDLMGKSPKSWRNWITNDLKLTEKQFYSIGEWNLIRIYLEKFFNEKIIPWSDRYSILTLITEKEKSDNINFGKQI